MVAYRCAVPEDLPAISRHLMAFYLEGRFREKGFRYDVLSVETLLNYAISQPNEFVLIVAEDAGACVGIIAGQIRPWMADHRQMTLNECLFYLDPKYRVADISRDLLSEYEAEGKRRGVQLIMMATRDFEKEKALMRYYKYRGYAHLEHCFVKEI